MTGVQTCALPISDSIGNADTNQKISVQRAQTVYDIVKKIGLSDRIRVNVLGEGESEPIDTNMFAPGRAKNRRVELKFSYED